MFSNTHITGIDERLSRRDASFLILLFLFTLILRFPIFYEPWGGDQGVYGFIANGMLEGKVPYTDMYTNTGYGLYFTYISLFKLFGNNMAALHIGDFIASLLTVFVVYYLTRMLYGKESALTASFFCALFGGGQAFSGLVEMKGAWGTYWQLAQRETFMTPLIAGGILLTLLADRNRKWFLYCFVGILIGMAAVFKATAALMLFITLAYIALNTIFGRDEGGFKLLFYKSFGMISGFIVINLPFIYYFWSHDSLKTMYDAVFVHTSLYAKLSRGNKIADAFFGNTYVISENLFLWLMSGVSIIYLMTRERTKENYLIAAWTVATMMMIWGQGKFFGYHFLLIMGPFPVLTGFGVKQFLKTMPSWKQSFWDARKSMVLMFLWVLLAGNLAVFAWNHYEYYRWHVAYITGKIPMDKYYEVFNEYPLHLYSFRADNEVASYLKEHAATGATLRDINGGGETVIQYLSGLKSPTRFTSTWYLFHKDLYTNPLTGRLRNEFIEEVKKEKPDYILLVYFTMEEFRREYSGAEYRDVIDLLDYLQSNYSIEKTFRDGRTLYRRI